MTFRATFYEKLNEALFSLNPDLMVSDFSFTVGPPSLSGQKESYDFELQVKYIYDTSYFFRFQFSASPDGNFEGTVTMSPGYHLSKASFKAKVSLDSLIGHIKQWRSALEEELVAVPIKRQFEEQQRLIDSLMDQFQDLPEEYFTRAEANEMKAKLDEFESRFTSHVNASMADSLEKQKKLEQLHQEIEGLKTQLDVLKKQGFFKRLSLRLFGVIGEETTKKLAGEGAEALGKFLKGYIGGGNGDGLSQ